MDTGSVWWGNVYMLFHKKPQTVRALETNASRTESTPRQNVNPGTFGSHWSECYNNCRRPPSRLAFHPWISLYIHCYLDLDDLTPLCLLLLSASHCNMFFLLLRHGSCDYSTEVNSGVKTSLWVLKRRPEEGSGDGDWGVMRRRHIPSFVSKMIAMKTRPWP